MFNKKMINAAEMMSYARCLGERFQVKELAQFRCNKARKYEQCAQRIVDMGWLTSQRGPIGGYELSSSGWKITMYDIVDEFINDDQRWALKFLENLRDVTPTEFIRGMDRGESV